MAGVTNFKDRITDLAGSLGTADDSAIEQWVLDGCYDIVTRVGATDNPMEFAQQSSAYNSSMTVSLGGIKHLIAVERNGIECNSVTHKKRHQYISSDSIYEATSDDPIFYRLNNQVIVKPNPTSSEQGYYTYIPEYSVTNFSSSTSTIDNFPDKYYEHVVLFAAIMTVARRMQDLMDDTAVNSVYSLDNLRNVINNDVPAADTDLFGLLAEEDIDMIQATIGVTTEAAKLINQKYGWLKEKIDMLLGQYMGKFPQSAQSQRGR